MPAMQTAALPNELTVIAYTDPIVEALGFGPDHPYTSRAILPVVGPSTFVLWLHLARLVIDAGDAPLITDTAELLACIGLGMRNNVGGRTFGRMITFDLARLAGRTVAVRTALAPLPQSQAARLPPSARSYHCEITGRPRPRQAGR
jgi:hypothetical protein